MALSDPATLPAQAISTPKHPVRINTPELAAMSLQQLCQLPHEFIRHQHRLDIMHAIRSCVAQSGVCLSEAETRKLVKLMMYLSDWPGLKLLQELGLWSPSPVEKSLADIQMGKFDLALDSVNTEVQSGAAEPSLGATQQELVRLIRQMPFPAEILARGALSLTPLQFYHVADFCWQYGDTEIAKLCNLPVFSSGQHWMAWLHLCQQEKERHLFAVMHQDYGFIGSVSLQVFDGIGFFYYWLGKDFQGQGFGPIAVELLMAAGRDYLGMHSCYAKVFDYNLASNRAITKLGFERLSLKALPPSEAEIFYYMGQVRELTEHHDALSWLLDKLNSGIHLKTIEAV